MGIIQVFIPRAIYGIKCLTCNVHCIPNWKEFTIVHEEKLNSETSLGVCLSLKMKVALYDS